MVDEPDDLIAPDAAVRILLRNDTLADEIFSCGPSWFSSQANRARQRTDALDRNAARVGRAALRRLRSAVKSGSVRLYGSYKDGQSKLIPLGDRQDGDLDIFERRLDVYRRGAGFEVETSYKRVFCVRADVLALVNLVTAATPSPPSTETISAPPRKRKRPRRLESAKAILTLIFPGDIPQDMEPKVLAKKAADEWDCRKKRGEVAFQGEVPSPSTIGRAAKALIKRPKEPSK